MNAAALDWAVTNPDERTRVRECLTAGFFASFRPGAVATIDAHLDDGASRDAAYGRGRYRARHGLPGRAASGAERDEGNGQYRRQRGTRSVEPSGKPDHASRTA